MVDSLQTVHHTSIITIGHGSDKGEELERGKHTELQDPYWQLTIMAVNFARKPR
jgi:hypothetical protein